MRIIGGLAAGRILQVPKGLGVRPTPDLVKQALFNSLGERIVDARVLDLFSGSGALGLESLSRGAQQVLSIEKSSKHARWIQGNVKECALPPNRHLMKVQDVFPALKALLEQQAEFDLIMADPPFGQKNVNRRSDSLSQKLLDLPELPNLLTQKGLFLLGHTKRDQITMTPWWECIKTMKHGDSVFEFLTPCLPLKAPTEDHP